MAADDFSPRDRERIEASTQEIGRQLLARRQRHHATLFERRWWDDRIMAWAMSDESVKTRLFRFVDALPTCTTSASVVRHLQEYLGDIELPGVLAVGLRNIPPESLVGRAIALAARRNAAGYARRFIAGTTTAEVLTAAMRERKLRRAFTLDLLGEAVTSDVEAERYLQQYLELIAATAPVAQRWPEVPQIDREPGGALPRVNVSVKLSALDSQFHAQDWDGSTARVAERLRSLLRVAGHFGAFVHVDMESYDKKDLTLHIFRRVLSEEEFRHRADVGIVIQCYLRDAERDLIALRDWARERGTSVWVRLVKGAYWDYETILAAQRGWPCPVWEQKWQSDDCYERMTRFLLLNHRDLRTALASHNLRSLAQGMAVARHLGLPLNALELQMLYGMADEEKQALVDLGYRLRIYMPYGELIPGMAYLVRRLLENTSNDSFLRASGSSIADPEKLFRPPQRDLAKPLSSAPLATARSVAVPCANASSTPGEETFMNEPLSDFGQSATRDALRRALTEVGGNLGQHFPLVIGGERVETRERLASHNPSHRRQVVGTTSAAERGEVEQAVAAAARAWPAWNATPIGERAERLRRVAAGLARRRFELSAWIIVECGKSWSEADADVAEAIDFCRYYADQALGLEGRSVDVPGEENETIYQGRGVAVVIAPWNFPLAILTGMTMAALVTGNTTIMKPAEQSAIVAAKLFEVCEEAGFPPGIVQFLPGRGELAGAALVEHPDVALIAFTGSRAVGLAIHRRAAELSAGGLPYVKRVIAELGGKNAIIVDDDADLDEAVVGVMHSAFGYQGQKCSACSRAIVLSGVHDTFVKRLVDATRSLAFGPAEDPAASLGPVIDAEAQSRIERYLELGRNEGVEALSMDPGPWREEGYFVGPHIFTEVLPTARIAQEEIFGPVLAVLRAENFSSALAMANQTEYALTGGVFSRSPAHLQQARRSFQVGNLYLNRGITGALVHRQPFGGFRLSGIGSKAGGPDYLLQFVVPRTVTENTLRRGFAPQE